MVCIIISRNQKNYLLEIIKAFERQKISPKMLYFVFDRCEDNSENYLKSIKSNIKIDFVIKNFGNNFCAGAARDYGLREYIKKYGEIEEVLFIDGDCIPNENVVKDHSENLKRINAPIISCGRRVSYDKSGENKGDIRDCCFSEYLDNDNYVFDEKNGKLLHSYIFHWDTTVSHSCNLAFNRKAIDLCYSINKKLNNSDRIFNSKFDGKWGYEDNFIGQILFLTNGYCFSTSINSFVEHKWHVLNSKNNNTRKNAKIYKNLINDLKVMINKKLIYTDNALMILKDKIKFDFKEINLFTNYEISIFYGINALGCKILNTTNDISKNLTPYFESIKYYDTKFKETYLKLLFSRNMNVIKGDKFVKFNKDDFNEIKFKKFIKEVLLKYITIKDGKVSLI